MFQHLIEFFIENALISAYKRFQTGAEVPCDSVDGNIQTTTIEMDEIIGKNQESSIAIKINDEKPCFEIGGQNVDVYLNPVRHNDRGSSRVKLKNIVDYKWEVKNYAGRLIAVHLGRKFLAYSIKVSAKGAVGMVRVVNTSNGDRTLIKGMVNEILDIQFAHLESQIILACIEDSCLHIHRVEDSGGKILTTFLLKIEIPADDCDSKYNKISWCPSVPQSKDEVDEYASQLLVWLHGNTFQCFSVNTIIEAYGTGSYFADDISEGRLKYKENGKMITCATFAPDGTTMAVGNEDGHVYFYQMYLHTKDSMPRRLHQWIPHDGKPVTCLLFLDNHMEYSAINSLWKHALTGAENNTELKLWRCDTWSCTQRITFNTILDQPLSFKVEIDHTSSYLVMSEMTSKTLYALQITKSCEEGNGVDSNDNPSTDEDGENGKEEVEKVNSMAFIKSIAEFPLSSPILSFCIATASVGKYKFGMTEAYLDDVDDFEEESSTRYCVVIDMFLVQPKSMQECHVFYQMDNAFEPESAAELVKSRQTSILSRSLDKPKSPNNIEFNNSLNTLNVRQKSTTQINLMTPESFQSPGKDTPENVDKDVMSTIRMLAASTTSPEQLPKQPVENMLSYAKLEEQNNLIRTTMDVRRSLSSELSPAQPQISTPKAPKAINNEILPSGSSSPSREVQEILSIKDEMFENIPSMEMAMDDELTASALNSDINKVVSSKILEDIDAIKLYVDDDDEENENECLNMDWPKVPNILPNVAQIEASTNHQNKANDNGYSINNLSGSGGNVDSKLDKILDLLAKQSTQINNLEHQVKVMEKNMTAMKESSVNANFVEAKVNQTMQEQLLRYERVMTNEMDQMAKKQAKQMTAFKDNLSTVLNKSISNQMTDKMASMFVTDLQRNVLSLISNELEKVKQQLQFDVNRKLSVSDQVLRENLMMVCTNKNFLDTISHSVQSGVHQTVNSLFMDAMNKTMIPAYERATKEMFKQINEMFQRGMGNYSKQIHSYMGQYQPVHDQNDQLLTTMKGLPDHLRVSNEKMVNCFSAQINLEINKDFKVLQQNILKLLKESIKSEISKGFESQVANLEDSVLSAVRSQAQTPSVFDIQEQIRQLLGQGQINKAFHQALIANDLSLVEFALEKADINTVFNPCTLEQTVLLSLIQQLSADMNNHNEIKNKYLGEAIMSLNMRDAVTREHAPKILKELCKNCQTYMADNPNGLLSNRVKMLLMVIQGLGISSF